MNEPVVIVERDRHGVATVTLNRPEVNNAYDRLVLQALSDGLAELSSDNGLRVLVLRGSACIALQNPDRIVDLSPGDHFLIPPHQRHRVERTDPNPGTLWLALHWDAPSARCGMPPPRRIVHSPKGNEHDS